MKQKSFFRKRNSRISGCIQPRGNVSPHSTFTRIHPPEYFLHISGYLYDNLEYFFNKIEYSFYCISLNNKQIIQHSIQVSRHAVIFFARASARFCRLRQAQAPHRHHPPRFAADRRHTFLSASSSTSPTFALCSAVALKYPRSTSSELCPTASRTTSAVSRESDRATDTTVWRML